MKLLDVSLSACLSTCDETGKGIPAQINQALLGSTPTLVGYLVCHLLRGYLQNLLRESAHNINLTFCVGISLAEMCKAFSIALARQRICDRYSRGSGSFGKRPRHNLRAVAVSAVAVTMFLRHSAQVLRTNHCQLCVYMGNSVYVQCSSSLATSSISSM